MKYIVVLCDGMADYPIPELDGKTPLEAAHKPHFDKLARLGRIGRMRTLYPELALGSDVANLSVLGYDPHKYYTGRSPVEALGLNIPLYEGDLVFRMNLVSLSGEGEFESLTMEDHSSGKITTEEALPLVEALADAFGDDKTHFHPGVSYRHLLVMNNGHFEGELTPPHDILGRNILPYLPKGESAAPIIEMMKESYRILSDHPVNKDRVKRGLRPANCLWLWGEGTKPSYPTFKSCYGIEKGMMITAVPLIRGLSVGMGLDSCEVEGATGDYYTNYAGKASAAIDALKNGYEFVFIHVEATDECGHDGDIELKVKAIERIDAEILSPILDYCDGQGLDYKVLITPDHATPISIRTHTDDVIPFVIYDSTKPGEGLYPYTEKVSEQSTLFYPDGFEMMKDFIS